MITALDTKNISSKVFQDIYDTYSGKLYDFIYSKTGSSFYSQEVVQMTFMKLWARRDQISPDIPVSTQLFQIAKTTLIDVLRKVEKDRLKTERFHKQASQRSNTGYEPVEERDVHTTLQKVMSCMPPVRKQVFDMRVQGQLSYKEISSELSISVKTVNKHMELAMRQIKPFFKAFLLFFCLFIK